MWANPQAFKDAVYGKSIDVDGAYGAQCWDLFAYFCQKEKVSCSTYCALTGYAGDLYKLRYQYGYDKFFEFFYPRHAVRGDWIFWDGHVAMVWDVYNDGGVLCLGQNQNGVKKVTLKTYKLGTALGCMRFKRWMHMNGWLKSNGKWYFFENGDKVTGWKLITWSKGTHWFHFNKEGAMETGWQEITYQGAKRWFYFDPADGYMYTGDHQIKGEWYHFDKGGVMATGEVEHVMIFNSSGELIGGEA